MPSGWTYEEVAFLTQTAVLLFFIAMFIAVVVYALWPGNRARFERAARLPLERDDDVELNGGKP